MGRSGEVGATFYCFTKQTLQDCDFIKNEPVLMKQHEEKRRERKYEKSWHWDFTSYNSSIISACGNDRKKNSRRNNFQRKLCGRWKNRLEGAAA